VKIEWIIPLCRMENGDPNGCANGSKNKAFELSYGLKEVWIEAI
jgi:hypothetical protein